MNLLLIDGMQHALLVAPHATHTHTHRWRRQTSRKKGKIGFANGALYSSSDGQNGK